MRDEENTAQSAGSLLGKIPMPSREKTWDECGIEDKVERLRRAMRNQKHLVEGAFQTAHGAHLVAHTHQHNAVTGEVLAPVNKHHGGAESAGRIFDPLA